MKYKIRYLFNKFYHLIKFIIPAFFVGTLSVNANVVPFECLQYEHYFNVASVYTANSKSLSPNKDSNFYNLNLINNAWLFSKDIEGNTITTTHPSFINMCTSNYTNETTGEVEVQNNYGLYEFTTTDTGNTSDIFSIFNNNSNAEYVKIKMDNQIFGGAIINPYTIDKTNDKLIYPMYFRSNKSNLNFTDIFNQIYLTMEYVNPSNQYTDYTDDTIFSVNTQDNEQDQYVKNFTMYYEQDHYYYYTFDLVFPLNDLEYDAYALPLKYQDSTIQDFYLEIYPNLDFILDNDNSPFGLFFGFSTAFFISNEVISGPNWIETGINEWIITNNPSESLGPLEEFFNNFNLQDNRGISQVITIPIRIVQSFLNSSCDSITLDIFTSRNDDNLTIPSGCSFWSTMTPIKNLLNIFVDGFICFEILKAVYLEIDKLKDPTDKSKIERSDL